jgi:hypothetical protein
VTHSPNLKAAFGACASDVNSSDFTITFRPLREVDLPLLMVIERESVGKHESAI